MRSWDNDTSIKWARSKLPDFAYFDHSAHVGVGVGENRAAIGCEFCCSRIDQAEVGEAGAATAPWAGASVSRQPQGPTARWTLYHQDGLAAIPLRRQSGRNRQTAGPGDLARVKSKDAASSPITSPALAAAAATAENAGDEGSLAHSAILSARRRPFGAQEPASVVSRPRPMMSSSRAAPTGVTRRDAMALGLPIALGMLGACVARRPEKDRPLREAA